MAKKKVIETSSIEDKKIETATIEKRYTISKTELFKAKYNELTNGKK